MNVNIYTYSGIKRPNQKTGMIGYVIETETTKGPVSVSGFKGVNASCRQSDIDVVIEALRRLKKPSVLSIYAGTYVSENVSGGHMFEWGRSGWVKKDGKPVANASEWQEMYGLLKMHSFRFLSEGNTCESWLKTECERREKECLINTENSMVTKK